MQKICFYFAFFMILWNRKKKKGTNNMKSNVQMLKRNEISSDVFIIAPSQIEIISQQFGDAVAEAMNIRPLSQKIREIAAETLTKILQDAKTMGE